jgi:hypothetical protein
MKKYSLIELLIATMLLVIVANYLVSTYIATTRMAIKQANTYEEYGKYHWSIDLITSDIERMGEFELKGGKTDDNIKYELDGDNYKLDENGNKIPIVDPITGKYERYTQSEIDNSTHPLVMNIDLKIDDKNFDKSNNKQWGSQRIIMWRTYNSEEAVKYGDVITDRGLKVEYVFHNGYLSRYIQMDTTIPDNTSNANFTTKGIFNKAKLSCTKKETTNDNDMYYIDLYPMNSVTSSKVPIFRIPIVVKPLGKPYNIDYPHPW